MKTVAFVPIRLNSKRVKGKNLKRLGETPLLSFIFKQLVQVKEIDEIYAYCSSEEIVQYLPDKVKFLKRNSDLDSDETLGQDIYDSFVKEIDSDIYILAHTTSPFIKAKSIEMALERVVEGDYDSSFSVEKIQNFTWFDDVPLNYSLDYVPRTQDLKPIYVETSAFFIFKKELWIKNKRRIGFKPFLQIVDRIEGIDIDNPDDFILAEKIFIASKDND